MSRLLDLPAFAVAALVAGDDMRTIGDAHLGWAGEHRQPAPYLGVRDRIIVEIETDIGRLAGLDRHLFDQGIGLIRQRQQLRRFLRERFAHTDGFLLWAAAVRRDAAAPPGSLGIERRPHR